MTIGIDPDSIFSPVAILVPKPLFRGKVVSPEADHECACGNGIVSVQEFLGKRNIAGAAIEKNGSLWSLIGSSCEGDVVGLAIHTSLVFGVIPVEVEMNFKSVRRELGEEGRADDEAAEEQREEARGKWVGI